MSIDEVEVPIRPNGVETGAPSQEAEVVESEQEEEEIEEERIK